MAWWELAGLPTKAPAMAGAFNVLGLPLPDAIRLHLWASGLDCR
jgi:hypothetical protein